MNIKYKRILVIFMCLITLTFSLLGCTGESEQERIIREGEEARQRINEVYSDYKAKENAIKGLAEKYGD